MASIGSLTADLKLESATFIRDLKRAADATARNTSAMQRQMNGLQRSFSAAGAAFKGALVGLVSVGTIRSINSLVNAAIQAGDEISEAATRIGISADDLQRFRFAAAQADVETSKLDNALRMFAQNLSKGEISAEGASMADAFRDYIQQIADAPTLLEKIRIAQEAFGKQWQTAMLLAKQGASEFQEQANSAFVVSNKALDVASQLDNQFRAFGNAVSAGFQTGLLEGFSDGLNQTRQRMEELNTAAQQLGQAVAFVIQVITNLLNKTASAFASVKQQWDSLPEALRTAISGAVSGMGFILNPAGSVAGLLGGGDAGPQLDAHVQAWQSASDAINNYNTALGVGVDVQKQAAEAARALNEKQQIQKQLFAETATPFEAYQLELAKLNELVAKGTIGWDLYSRAVEKVTQDFQMNWMNSLQGAIGQMQGFTGALAQESKTWFQINKAFAIAQAIMSTYEGAAKALGQLGAWGPPVAAGIIATGLAYVAMIASQQPGSSGGSRGGRGGSGRGGGGGNGISESVGRSQAVNITLVGSSGFTSEQVLDLMQQINGFIADGVHLNVSQG